MQDIVLYAVQVGEYIQHIVRHTIIVPTLNRTYMKHDLSEKLWFFHPKPDPYRNCTHLNSTPSNLCSDLDWWSFMWACLLIDQAVEVLNWIYIYIYIYTHIYLYIVYLFEIEPGRKIEYERQFSHISARAISHKFLGPMWYSLALRQNVAICKGNTREMV